VKAQFQKYTRRVLIGGAAAAAAFAAKPRNSVAAEERSATFVLIHGAWHGGWCWERVSHILQKKGHKVYAPTLTGVGERSHLANERVNLTTHVLDVVNEVKWKDLDSIVLCGHSYGGMVITGAAEQIHERVSAIVYLDAFLPQNGQSLDDIVGAVRDTKGPVPPITAEQFNVNAADRAWVNSKMTPQSAACFSEKLVLTGAVNRIAKKTYVMANIGTSPPFRANYERLKADRAWRTFTVDCGHDVMIDKPAELADILSSVK
jgi:pimeloyl-ACP methyl ester carboxylesterase